MREGEVALSKCHQISMIVMFMNTQLRKACKGCVPLSSIQTGSELYQKPLACEDDEYGK